MALVTWFCPSSIDKPAQPKVGPGNPSPDLTRIPDPWDVLRFDARGYLTVDTEDAHYPEWRKWLDATAPAYGLRIISDIEAEAANDPTAIGCPVSESCDWRGPAAARDQHILAHRPGADYYEPPKHVTLGTAF